MQEKLSKKLKVAVVIDQLLPGGVQKAAIHEVENLNKLSFDASLLILMRKGFEKRNSYLIGNYKHEFLSDRYPKILQRSFKIPIFKFLSTLHLVSPILAPLNIKKGEFDIIISHGTTTSLTIWSIHKFTNIPYIAVIHDPMVYILDKVYSKTALKFFFPFLKPLATMLENKFIKSSSLCLVDSSVHVEYIKKKYDITPQVLYLGIKPPLHTPKKLGNKIVSFGRWDKEKNLTVLLELARLIPASFFIIAGTWSNKKDLEWFKNEIKKRNLKNINLITKYRENDLSNICRQGRLWIHPHFEAFSLSALEAASYGLPIIIPEKSGITELFKNKQHGFFPKYVSANILISLISPLLKDERLAWKMGNEAARLVKQHYTFEIHADILAKAIRKIIDSKKKKMLALEIGHVGETGISGGDLLLAEMVKFIKTPIELKVVVPENNTYHWEKYKINKELIPLKRTYFDKFTGPWGIFITYVLRIVQSSRIIFKIRPPFIIYSSTGIFPDVTPAFLNKITRRNIFWIARIHHISLPPNKRPGIYWVNLGSHILENISLRMIKVKADKIIVLNNNLKKELEKRDFDANKMTVLGGGVDFRQISRTKPPKTKYFDGVFLGRLHYAKGILDLVPIWKKVIEIYPYAKLGIIGIGPREITDIITKQIKSEKLSNNVMLLNFLPQKQVWETLKSSKTFLFTDHEAGFGLAVAEAMAAGIPIVGWDIGILGSVFKKGFIKIPPYDHDLFAKAIIKLLKVPKLRQKLSSEAIVEAEKIDWSITSRKFTKILELS